MLIGPPGSGKSYFAASLMRSAVIDSKKVVYFDNHGSTDALGLHHYTQAEPWGVAYISFEEPGKLKKAAESIRTRAMKGKPMYEGIVIDDISQHASTNVRANMVGEKGDKRRAWGEHLSEMQDTFYHLEPADTQAALIVIARAARMTQDISEVKVTKDTKVDEMPTTIRAHIQGQFGEFIGHFFDMIVYCKRYVIADKLVFRQHYWPVGDIEVKCRWWHEPTMPRHLDNTTYDQLWNIIKGFDVPAAKVETQLVDMDTPAPTTGEE